ncbi:type II toxin-antitoxin system RelE/ParE family toxin [Rhizobium sp. CSW-27]|uniref:type II toxin-antitoxin system RelE/ParE family toxin n=1 Tax=Rhizobium sp. CSW-27 TaxID=2839985 RepID=UPI001C0181BB|nr:type II toxin-antitoxin system RelE/ParE family toxin [Rhizobium sp. CSW-27]MBT9370678.1 type II toxin-antitoxin system RelE/ParE family toxin [Rhizobium sp. CSW-27]
MKTLIISPRAADDIDEIYDYTEARWGQDQAEDYTFGIRQALQDVCRGTKKGRSINHIRKGAMSLSFRSHYLIYQEKAASLILIRILHQRMNIGHHL